MARAQESMVLLRSPQSEFGRWGPPKRPALSSTSSRLRVGSYKSARGVTPPQ